MPETYFQTPPPPSSQKSSVIWRVFRTLVYCSISAFLGVEYAANSLKDDILELTESLSSNPQLTDGGAAQILATGARTLARQNSLLNGFGDPFERDFFITSLAVNAAATIHQCQAPSNMPCEDLMSLETFALRGTSTPQVPITPDLVLLGLFDGHAGLDTAGIVRHTLPAQVMMNFDSGLDEIRAGRAFNDTEIRESMEKAFATVDQALITRPANLNYSGGHGLRDATMTAIQADAGTCALMALYDAQASRLHIANLGDSRAVLGRWDSKLGRYKAIQLSEDHTGFNQDEVARLAKEHPGEKCIDEKTGRLFGLAVTRAFGDARWKWSNQATEYAHRNYFTNSPRPNGVVKTPPYLSAIPEVTHTDIQTGEHPDFLIMASDGLWDQLSSEAAVELVQLWLDKFVPSDHIVNLNSRSPEEDALMSVKRQHQRNYIPGEKKLDVYYDEKEKAIKWKSDKSHYIVERSQCAEHLIQNALGGNRRELFDAVMSLPPSHSRNVRDDISVSVSFFGADISRIPEPQRNSVIVT